ncbi:DUF6998 domain-containing protein [Sphingobium fluviale]|uniref:DUF6998 domain-containing protein n=1 Tax=Sphingobium fluviale TaxID=2506423 RepID=A0A4Q1KFJ1_9SPHN|nr:hypothetical protein [Sphingobium fluviale]RXR28463.1 hypothetical protein EQG66_10525 [Sphingobium fluviale]
MGQPVALSDIAPIIDQARDCAVEYYRLTRKPLGITGEVGEFEAARLLGLTLLAARSPGYDAIAPDGRKIQIKARLFDPTVRLTGQRVGSIKVASEFDAVVLVMLDLAYQPWIIWEASRTAVIDALLAPGSKSRNERGAMSVVKFRSIAAEVWRRE